jgi:hypothetical protein
VLLDASKVDVVAALHAARKRYQQFEQSFQ